MNLNDLFNKYNNLKFRVKLNNAMMEGVAKAIGEEAEKEIRARIKKAQEMFSNTSMQSKTISNESDEELISDSFDEPSALLEKKRNFDEVMDLMEELRKL